jgi:L-cysteine S-thiosulfotransferase
MKRKLFFSALGMILTTLAPALAHAGPKQDRKAFVQYFEKRFPDLKLSDWGNGAYSLDPDLKAQWEAIEEFPPYVPGVDTGKKLFETPFKNGKTYASCFKNKGIGIVQDYPYFDTKRGEVVTLAMAVNECRSKNGEKPLPYGKGKIADILAYMAFTSRGKKTHVVIPKDPRALEAYEKGKHFYYAKRGQLNFACADCHVLNPGRHLRSDLLSPALGQTTHWPVYRATWGNLGTLHRRFVGCNQQVRAKPFKPQSEEYRDLEYFLTYMNDGLPLNGPASRK